MYRWSKSCIWWEHIEEHIHIQSAICPMIYMPNIWQFHRNMKTCSIIQASKHLFKSNENTKTKKADNSWPINNMGVPPKDCTIHVPCSMIWLMLMPIMFENELYIAFLWLTLMSVIIWRGLVGLSSQTIFVLGPMADSISCKFVVSTRLQ